MKSTILFVVLLLTFILLSSSWGAENAGDDPGKTNKKKVTALCAKPYTPNRDIAFVSVWGSRPNIKKLQGFQRAVLYNAQGAVLQEIDISRSDSIYSLDRMLQENKTKGPLFVKMVK